jgi:peptidoglycan/xylan/chitin deacetylase (PgdA/CDA1 family)
MTIDAYAPPRDLASKVRRRMTQWRASKPMRLAFCEPILSITFDDFPVSAAVEGARVLESHGARGVYYASAGLAETTGPCGRNFSAADVRRLSAAGHEIGCHSYAHSDAARRDVFSSLEDLAKNRDALVSMGARPPRTHAYPYGETTSLLKDGLPPRFHCARGVLGGVNRGQSDLAQLRAFDLFGVGWRERVSTALKQAAKRKGWVIGFTHDVADAPSAWGTRSVDLDALLHEAHQLGFVVLPVSAALERRIA